MNLSENTNFELQFNESMTPQKKFQLFSVEEISTYPQRTQRSVISEAVGQLSYTSLGNPVAGHV